MPPTLGYALRVSIDGLRPWEYDGMSWWQYEQIAHAQEAWKDAVAFWNKQNAQQPSKRR